MTTKQHVYNIPEVAKILRIGRGLAYELARRGEIPTVRLGRRLLVPRAALDRLLEVRPKSAGDTPESGS